MIRLIVDSTCDIPKEYIKENNIEVLPLRILLNETEFLDGYTITVDEVYNAMREGILPVTSQPTPDKIYEVFSDYGKKGQEFIYIAFSSALSGTCQLAQSILNDVKNLYPHVNMAILDSQSGSTATGLLVLQALRFIKEGNMDFHEIILTLEKLINHIEHVFTIADLGWLIKGGRIGKVQGTIGNILNINPVLDVDKGRMEVIQKVRGRKKVLNVVVDLLEERAGTLKDQIIGISHADDLDTANELVETIKERMGCTDFIVNKIGSVLGSHLGIGGVGIFFFNEGAADILNL